MATTTATTFSKILKTLRENCSVKEKREALTYISSQAKKLESSGTIKEERYKELCKLIIDAFTKEEGSLQYEALGALNAIVQEFKTHSLHLFESMLQTDKKTRLKVLKLLEVVEDNAISAPANDGQALTFFKDCMSNVQPNLMEWITPTACVDNLQLMTKVEQQILSDEQKLEEDIINHSLALLKRLYKLAATTFDQNVEKFDTLLMDKVVTLAYMGHKRQRGLALKVLQQSIVTNSSSRIRKDHPDLWAQYKTNLLNVYCKRMLLLVSALEPDWTTQWNITIQFLGTDLHRGAGLINGLLSVEEKAFKSTDAIIRRQAFLSWKLLIDNFALDNQELATLRRIKLLCIPLNAKNSKTELIALTKLEVWWHLIIKLYKDIDDFVNPVITQFLNFCFGPLGDTPLLSTKFDVVASPGKRFFKTKMVAVNALYQLIVPKEENSASVCPPILEERLPNTISHAVFLQCSKSIIDSTGEALLILGQLTDQEMKNRHMLGKILWRSLMKYITDVKLERKDHLYKNVILIVTELGNHVDKFMVKDMIFSVILPDLSQIIKHSDFTDNVLSELLLKLLSLPVFAEVPKGHKKFNAIECLLQRRINTFTSFSGVFGFLETIMENLKLTSDTHKHMASCIEFWSILAKLLTEHIRTNLKNKNNERDENRFIFKIIKTILIFPFQHAFLENAQEMQYQVAIWKALYKQFELLLDSISALKSNEMLLDTADMMQICLNANKNCSSLIVDCLDSLLSTINYECLLAQDEIPSIMELTIDVLTISFYNLKTIDCEITLKALSAILITIYGHNPQKVMIYLRKCKSVIELTIKASLTPLFKEIANLWETVISIFKGLKKQLDYELILLYQEAIITAINHLNSDIRSLTQSIFDIKDDVNDVSKCVLNEIEKTIKASAFCPKSDNVTKKKEKAKRVAGSFLSKKSANTKSVANKPWEKDKKAFILPDVDSQDYVYIKTDLKFDVNRLTEHQKETLKKKREDIPALYNDLSQSSSQNSQNLQEWFNIKAKTINELDRTNKKGNSVNKPNNDDVNRENEITVQDEPSATKQLIITDTTNDNCDESNQNIEENTVDNIKQNENLTKEISRGNSNLHTEDKDTSRQTKSIPYTQSEQNPILEAVEKMDVINSTASIVKKINFESREEVPENKQLQELPSSPSLLDSIKRRHRNSITKLNSSLKSDETVENQNDSDAATNAQRMSRLKISQEKPGTSKSLPNDIDIKESEDRKSIKRKLISDTESDSIMQQRRKRKLLASFKSSNDDDSDKSRDSDVAPLEISDMDNVSQRVKNEMSRLKIDMVFDCPILHRRRVKYLDEEDKEYILKKSSSLDNRNTKSKSIEARSTEGSRRFPKMTEKNVEDKNDMNQTSKRRGRRSTKQESDLNINKEYKKSNTDKISPLKNSADSDMTVDSSLVVPTSSHMQDVTITRCEDKILNEDNSKGSSSKNEASSEIVESNEQSRDENEDVIENSQAPSVDLKLDKKCNEKQCFIKINKMLNVLAAKSSEAAVEKNYVPESIPMDCGDNDVVPDPCEQLNEVNSNVNTDINDKSNKDSVNIDSAQENNNSNIKLTVLEDQKAVDSSPSIKSVTNFLSPKSGSKLFSKVNKPFTPHGRAAHMLGLVTKHSLIDVNNPSVIIEDDSVKKSKTKDVENETSVSKRTSMFKEIDKISGPSGSRQEKIFNNMRSVDHCTSVSTNAFTTLKNDGEKLSPKLNKTMLNCLSMDGSVNKENEGNLSPLREKEDLPILEWSSANPPSLTASPSISILKRQRSTVPELDLDSTTPSKRKRVSFADPPVSKEMGYEISVESPSKANKSSTSRSPVSKKESPLRFKQTKLKFISDDAEKSTGDNAQSGSSIEMVMEIEKADESLTGIPATCLDIDISEHMPTEFIENNNVDEENPHVRNRIDKPVQEVTTAPPRVSEDQQFTVSEIMQNTTSINSIETEDSQTQQDIFDEMDMRRSFVVVEVIDDDQLGISIQDNLENSIKLNVTDDSVIEALPTKENNLEDTVDIQNITELNSTLNSDEIFCRKLPCTSMHETEKIAEQDTLPVTDSIFASLPSTQDSRGESQDDEECDPEFLNDVRPIYPNLVSCKEHVDNIVKDLTNPLWIHNLSTYFASRNVRTIGDLAKLSEREIYRIPVKGKPKIQFVKKVLQRFENTPSIVCKAKQEFLTSTSCTMSPDKVDEISTMAIDEAPSVLTASTSDSVKASTSINTESLSCSTPLSRSNETMLGHLSAEKSPAEHLDRTESTSSDICSMDTSSEPGNSDLLTTSRSVNKQASAKVPIRSLPGMSTDDDKLVPLATSSTCANTIDTSEISPKSSNVSDELLVTHSSTGTNTDDVSFVTPVSKATKSVESQMALEDLLDEIDINLVLENAIRRCSPDAILSQYKVKMGHLSETELVKETVRMLGFQNKRQLNDALLKMGCRSYGVNKVLLRLPDIFSSDKQFFDRVLKVYNKKLKIQDCVNAFGFNELKNAICQKCTSSEIVEMLSNKLKQEERDGIKQPMPEVSSLNAMLQRLPMDVIISHTVANEEVIPASVVLDIALQNNSSGDIARALKAQSPVRAKRVLDKLWSTQFITAHIENEDLPKESLLNIFKSVCSKLTPHELLDAYHENMTGKLIKEDKKD